MEEVGHWGVLWKRTLFLPTSFLDTMKGTACSSRPPHCDSLLSHEPTAKRSSNCGLKPLETGTKMNLSLFPHFITHMPSQSGTNSRHEIAVES